MTYRLGASVLAASNVLLALLVDQILGVHGNEVQDGHYAEIRQCQIFA
jgi:hypothetical protein